MARLTVKEFAVQNGFNMISKVRKNTNGYMFATFLTKEDPNHVENVYFGVRFAEEGGLKEGDALPIGSLYVTDVENAAGEQRWKLTDRTGDNAATLASMGYSAI